MTDGDGSGLADIFASVAIVVLLMLVGLAIRRHGRKGVAAGATEPPPAAPLSANALAAAAFKNKLVGDVDDFGNALDL